ncbi:Hypothetical protein R9X50_00401700 [Acrodontium crateriforme]|uniref:Uncharacterized protein n=1 Tax=Acrodontium crateriforme TaxID=150365 RepID=A0AAQ3M786_9PEZI|nr:Hypothetical protein R9X50_00401700 [Acrodontium crateriforme]
MSFLWPYLTALLALLLASVRANTEKVIFLAPAHTTFPDAAPSLDSLFLDTLTPEVSTLRLAVPVAFPAEHQPRGLVSWYLLRGLNKGQRYEVRICWAAIQPTELWLDVFNITHVFDTPDLIQSLAAFSEQKVPKNPVHIDTDLQRPLVTDESVLFLRLNAAADFFTTNETLMRDPPSVDSELILDPFLANIFPQSLVPTAFYITILAIGSYFLSKAIWLGLSSSAIEAKKHKN